MGLSQGNLERERLSAERNVFYERIVKLEAELEHQKSINKPQLYLLEAVTRFIQTPDGENMDEVIDMMR